MENHEQTISTLKAQWETVKAELADPNYEVNSQTIREFEETLYQFVDSVKTGLFATTT